MLKLKFGFVALLALGSKSWAGPILQNFSTPAEVRAFGPAFAQAGMAPSQEIGALLWGSQDVLARMEGLSGTQLPADFDARYSVAVLMAREAAGSDAAMHERLARDLAQAEEFAQTVKGASSISVEDAREIRALIAALSFRRAVLGPALPKGLQDGFRDAMLALHEVSRGLGPDRSTVLVRGVMRVIAQDPTSLEFLGEAAREPDAVSGLLRYQPASGIPGLKKDSILTPSPAPGLINYDMGAEFMRVYRARNISPALEREPLSSLAQAVLRRYPELSAVFGSGNKAQGEAGFGSGNKARTEGGFGGGSRKKFDIPPAYYNMWIQWFDPELERAMSSMIFTLKEPAPAVKFSGAELLNEVLTRLFLAYAYIMLGLSAAAPFLVAAAYSPLLAGVLALAAGASALAYFRFIKS